jgi:undecaprenyl diphosphate synthase
MRVYELAGKIGTTSLAVMRLAEANDVEVYSPLSSLDAADVETLNAAFLKAGLETVKAEAESARDKRHSKAQRALKAAAEATADVDGMLVNVAVPYGGRREIADAVRALLADHASKGTSLEELADIIDVEHIAEHLYTKGQPDPDLVIRTSGEQRLGGFLLWQSANSEFYFCEALWPDFRRENLFEAVREFQGRDRRFGAVETD